MASSAPGHRHAMTMSMPEGRWVPVGTAHVGRCRCRDTSKMRATVTATVEYSGATHILICPFADAQTLKVYSMHLGVRENGFACCSRLCLSMRRNKTGIRGMNTQGKKSRRSQGLVELRYTSVLLCPSRKAPFSSSLPIRNLL